MTLPSALALPPRISLYVRAATRKSSSEQISLRAKLCCFVVVVLTNLWIVLELLQSRLS